MKYKYINKISCAAIQSNLILGYTKKNIVQKIACGSDITAVGPTMNIFNYNAVWSENRTHHLPDAEEKSSPPEFAMAKTTILQ